MRFGQQAPKENGYDPASEWEKPGRRKKQIRYVDKRDKRSGNLRIVVIVFLLGVSIYSGVMLTKFIVRSVATKRTNETVQAIHEEALAAEQAAGVEPSQADETPVPRATKVFAANPNTTTAPITMKKKTYQYIGNTILPQVKELLSHNRDLVAWLSIPDVVDLPVVYRDNSYYLTHDFFMENNTSGTLFLDVNHPLKEDTQYLVIHGHNMRDGSMFGRLSHYRDYGYMADHPLVYLTTLYREEVYQVIGVLWLPGDTQNKNYVSYTGRRKFSTTQQFKDFTAKVRGSAIYWAYGAEMKEDDALLALSTCYEKDRVVVMCKRISPE